MRGRTFSNQATQHIYQRTKDHGVWFYTTLDRLVYYSLAACKAKKYRVQVLAASIMYTHLHQTVRACCLEDLRAYLQDTNSCFGRLYNYEYHRKGQLFDDDPGRSQKNSSKEQRSNLIYVYNNHVEKGLCSRAVEERWSFLAFAVCDNPFSKAIDRKRLSKPLSMSMKLVDRRVGRLKALEYQDLHRIQKRLTEEEWEQFVDYAITKYAWIDYDGAVSLFGGLKEMILAIDSTTGGEYDIREDYSRLKDTGYRDMIAWLEREHRLSGLFALSDEERMELLMECRRQLASHPDHLRRMFHVE